MNILFLNVGRRCELMDAFRKALDARGGGMIAASDISLMAPALYKADCSAILPHSAAPDFPEKLAEFCKLNSIALLIPSIDPDLEILDSRRQEIAKLCQKLKLLMPPSSTIRAAHDKRESKRLFAKLGAKVPEDVGTDPKSFPVFVKPPDGSAGKDARRIDSAEELRQALASNPDLMVERIVDGPEYTVDVLCDFNGKALCAVPRRRLKVRGGEVAQGVVEMIPELMKLAMRLAEGFKVEGPATLQFRSPAPGEFVAMEMNARMGGGLPLAIAAGADWPGMILDMADGRKPCLDMEIRDGLAISRHDASVFITPGRTQLPCAVPPSPRLSETPELLKGVSCFVFDMDDTLYSERDFVSGGHAAAAKMAWELLGVDIESRLRELMDSGIRDDRFAKALKAEVSHFDESIVKRLVEAYRTHTPCIHPYPDVEVIAGLRAKGFKTALISDGWEAVQMSKLQALGIESLFGTVLMSDSLGGKDFWKPSKEPFLHVLRSLGLKGESAVYVADNPAKDFIGARACGMKTLRLRRPATEHFKAHPPSKGHAPDAQISSLREICLAMN